MRLSLYFALPELLATVLLVPRLGAQSPGYPSEPPPGATQPNRPQGDVDHNFGWVGLLGLAGLGGLIPRRHIHAGTEKTCP